MSVRGAICYAYCSHADCKRSSRELDKNIEDCARTLAGAVLHSDVFRELQSPAKLNDAKHTSPGIGLIYAENIAAVEFLPSGPVDS